ncbi:MAG TPA: PAS domain S-box protein [bacterium]|jgi:PAS domain S-box-containing protein
MIILWLGVSVTLLFFVAAGVSVWKANFSMIHAEASASALHDQLRSLSSDHERRSNLLMDAVEQRDTVSWADTPPDMAIGVIGALTLMDASTALTSARSYVAPLRLAAVQLLHMQDTAVRLLGSGNYAAARTLMESAAYVAECRTLHENVRAIMRIANAQTDRANRIFTAHLMWISVVASIFFLALTTAWLAVMRLMSSHLDVRKKTEADLRESEEKYRTLIDALPQAVLIAKDGIFVFCNPRAAVILGATGAGSLIGLPAETIVREEDREGLLANVAAQARQDSDLPDHYTVMLRRLDGSEFPAEVFVRSVLYKGAVAAQYVLSDITERQRGESALRESEEKYRTLIDSLPHSVVILQDGKVVFANNATAAALGFQSSQDLIGLDRDAFVAPRERERLNSYTTRRVGGEGGAPDHYSATLRRRNEEEFPAEVFVQTVAYGGKPALQTVILDATERQRAEHALRESEERFRNLSDTAPVLIWMGGVGRHTFYFNKSWLRFTGRSVSQEYGHGWKQDVHPDDLPRCMAAYESAFESRTAFTVEYRLRHMDGTDHWVLDTGVPRFTIDGNFAGYVGSCVDITTRRGTEEALRESERRFRELADLLPHTIFESDDHGALTFANRKALEVFGYSVQDIERGPNLLDMLIPADRERARENMSRIMRGETLQGSQYMARRKDGQPFPVVIDSNVRIEDGRPCGLRGMVIDVTERQRTENELRHLNRALKTTGECSQAVVHATDEAALLHDICQIMVQSGGYRMVWVGKIDQNGDKTVKPAAFAGKEQGYLESITITWDDSVAGNGPTGMAIKTLKPWVNRDVAGTDFNAWQEEALKRGYRSSVALPLVGDGRCFGVLSIYSAQTDHFDPAEVKLLSQLADDLAYGITALRVRQEQMRTETALRESEITLRRTFDQSPIGAGIVSLEGHFLRSNDTLCQMLGYTREELETLTYVEITHPDDSPRDMRNVALLATGDLELYETDKRYIRKNGTVMWGHLSLSAVKDPAGKAVYYLPMVQDITERKRVETALLESEEHFRTLYDQAPVGYQSLNEEGCLIDVNETWLSTLGYSREDVLGHWFGDFLALADKDLFRQRFPMFCKIGEVHGVEFDMIRKDGSRMTVSYEGRIARNIDGGFKQTHCIFHDITRRKDAENLLREQAAAFDAAMDGMAILDSQGRYLYLNGEHARLYGYDSPQELVGKSWMVLYDDEELRRMKTDVIPEVWRKGCWHGAAVGKRRDGSRYRQELSLCRTETNGLACVVRYISERDVADLEPSPPSGKQERAVSPEEIEYLAAKVLRQLEAFGGYPCKTEDPNLPAASPEAPSAQDAAPPTKE